MTIDEKEIRNPYFLFDGCHKFYLLNSKRFTKRMRENGYERSDIHPIDELPYEFFNSCSLRFIETWDNLKTIVPQCKEQVKFSGFGKFGYTSLLDFAESKVYTDEMLFKSSPFGSVIFQNMR